MDGASYMVRGGVVLQNGLVTQNLVQGTSYTLQPSEFSMNLEVKPSLAVGVLYTSATVNTLVAISAHPAPDGDMAQRVSCQGAPLTMNAATQVTVGAASSSLIAANPLRRYLLISNCSSAQRMSIAFGAAAATDTGITLQAGQSYEMSEAAGNLCLSEVRGWASAAGVLIGVQEGV